MKLSKRTIIVAAVFSVILLVTGYFSWGSIFNFILPVKEGTPYVSTSLVDSFNQSIVFALALALVPVATILIWKFASIISRQRRALSVCIIILAIIGSMWARREMIKSALNNLHPVLTTDYSDPANPVQKEIRMGLQLSDLKFEKFAFIGLVAGSIVSFFALRQGSPENISTAE